LRIENEDKDYNRYFSRSGYGDGMLCRNHFFNRNELTTTFLEKSDIDLIEANHAAVRMWSTEGK